MARYLDPKADLTFKKVFGEHPNLVASLLNSLLPLPDGEEIVEVEYMSPELVPRTYFGKNSIVDVCCRTKDGRQFIVEMQMFWTADFKNRVLFNSAKVYVDQLERAEDFSSLRPVYSLNLVDEIFEKDIPEFIHHYQMVHEKYSEKLLEGFHLVFVELPKFKPQTIAERKMAVLWLRFLTEIDNTTEIVPPELLESKEIRQAVELVEESAYTRAQLRGYDKFWDYVRVDKTLASAPERSFNKGKEAGILEGMEKGKEAGLREGMEKGKEAGLREGMEKGKEAGLREGKFQAARQMMSDGMTVDLIMKYTGLTADEIAKV